MASVLRRSRGIGEDRIPLFFACCVRNALAIKSGSRSATRFPVTLNRNCPLDKTASFRRRPTTVRNIFCVAQENRTRNTQGLKLHVLYAGNEAVPVQHSLTPPNVNDIDEGVKIPIKPGAVYVFDKGYCDYNGGAGLTPVGRISSPASNATRH